MGGLIETSWISLDNWVVDLWSGAATEMIGRREQREAATGSSGFRIFRQRLEVRGNSNEGDLSGFGTVFFKGFEWCSHQLKTRTGRGRTKEDKAMRFGRSKWSAEKLLGRCRKKRKEKN
jgi:hypothetical protein